MRNKEGISLIVLVTTIVVILILIGITVFNGLRDNTKKAAEVKTTYEVFSFIDAVNNRKLLHQLNPSYYDYIGDNDFGTKTVGTGADSQSYSSAEGWYYVSTRGEFAELGLDNVQGEYLINYEDGLAVNLNGVQYQDTIFYSMNDLKVEMGGGSVVLSPVNYDSEKKVNKPILTTGMVPVKLSGGRWVVTSEDDNSWYDYSLDQQAWANVMFKDDLKVTGFTNEELRKASLTDLVGKEVEKEGSAYVWIPRYTATSVGETGSKIIFSYLTSDTTSFNGETYNLPEAFTYGSGADAIQLPGYWMSKYEASLDN